MKTMTKEEVEKKYASKPGKKIPATILLKLKRLLRDW
jgi:hypothetical protein